MSRVERHPSWNEYAVQLLRWSGARNTNQDAPSDWRFHEPDLRARGIDSLHYLSRELPNVAQRVYDKVWRAQRDALEAMLACATQVDLPVLVFKGADAIVRYYEGRPLGLMADCDVLVQRADLVSIQAILYGLGYRPAIFNPGTGGLVDRDIANIAEIESRHYELAPFSRMQPLDFDAEELEFARRFGAGPLRVVVNQAFAVIEFDVHHRVAADVDSAPLLARARPGLIPNALALSAEDSIWYILSKHYTEVALFGKRGLRDLAYVAPAIVSESIDWQLISQVGVEQELHCSLFYPLRTLQLILGEEYVPANVLRDLAPDACSRIRDWGWQLGKLFDVVEPFPLVDVFSVALRNREAGTEVDQ